MKKSFVIASCLMLTCLVSAQPDKTWSGLEKLTGVWVGEGSGQPGQGSGTFSFSHELDGKIIVRKSHSEYPAETNKPKIIHDDLMIIYPGQGVDPARAIYFDNEGHKIEYTVIVSDNSIVFTGDKVTGTPVFRLVYTFLDNDRVNTRFEMSQDGVRFMTYVEGVSRKSKQ